MQKLLLIIAFASVSVSCFTGGDDSGGRSAPTAAVSTTVSGTVSAPGGAIAFNKALLFEDLFATEAYAALSGVVVVPDGTIVQLARFINGTNVSVISTTTTSQGRYSFDLTALGLQPANDLVVRVTGSNGTQMRAFVVGNIADINPVSEAACEIIIQAVGSTENGNGWLRNSIT